MSKLFEGARKFLQQEYPKHQELFSELKNQQDPHTLFITCSDSRIQPGLITQTLPGELFVIRNVANIVPPYEASSEHPDTLAAIEYAVQVLDVDNIVVCGHSNCGGCRALYASEDVLESLPQTRYWINWARDAMLRNGPDDQNKMDPQNARKVEQNNVKLQMQHLLTHPFVRERHQKDTLRIYGWYYDIGQGLIMNYNHKLESFENIHELS